MNQRHQIVRGVRIAVAMTLCACLPPVCFGDGFEVPNQAAKASGQAEAFTAQANDPSAIYYNPAGLTQVPGTQIQAGAYALFFNYHFEGPSGTDNMAQPAYLPHLYMSTDLGTKDLRLGLGINNVFGLGVNWGKSGPLRYEVQDAKLTVLNIAPTVAFRVNDHLSLGASTNIYRGDVKLHSAVPFPGAPDGEFQASGGAWGMGYTLAALVKINEQHSLGGYYRSGFNLNFDGHARISSPLGTLDGPSTSSLDLPSIVRFGYAYRPVPKLKLEADVEWANWSTLNSFTIHAPAIGSPQTTRLNYHDSVQLCFGGEYQLDDNWFMRAGYTYAQSSAPNSTFTPLDTDLNAHGVCAGLGYTSRQVDIDLAYQYIFREGRSINDSVNSPRGRYSDQTHAIMLSLTYKF